MDQSLLKNLLSSEFYNNNKSKLKRSLFSDEAADLYGILCDAHEKYQHDLSTKELMILFDLNYPVATRAEKEVVEDLIGSIQTAPDVSPDVAHDAIENLWRREIGREIADEGINMTNGHYEAMNRVRSLIERSIDGYLPDDFGDPTTDDLDELLAETGDDARWAFNIPTLSRSVYGIGAGEFGIIFATPETGKTAFAISLIAGPGGFCEQGAKVLYLGNEEITKRTKLRAYQAWTGMTRDSIVQNPDEAKRKYTAIKDRLIMKDTQDWDLDRIESYIEKINPDLICIDQADKVQIAGQYNAGHERLRELYRRLRETSKRFECGLLAVSQASADADGKTRLTYTMMEGSKIGKAAESDLILGLGRHSGENEDNKPDNTRFITVSKNKLSGWHGTIVCSIEPEVSRYVA